jgi:hypothetical protein
VVGPYQPIIDQILREGTCEKFGRSSGTAMEVYCCLRDEHGYRGSYASIRRQILKQRRRDQAVSSGIVCLPGQASPGRVTISQQTAPCEFRADGTLPDRFPQSDGSLAMSNFLKISIVATIFELYGRGWSQRRIAHALDIDRETVAGYLRHGVPQTTTRHATRGARTANRRSNSADLGIGPSTERPPDRSSLHTDWMLGVLQGKEPLDSIRSICADGEALGTLVNYARSGQLKARNKAVCAREAARNSELGDLRVLAYRPIDRQDRLENVQGLWLPPSF